jgi:hypothetical protein
MKALNQTLADAKLGHPQALGRAPDKGCEPNISYGALSSTILISRSSWIVLLLLLFTFALYWPVHQFDFVQYDDDEYIFNNQTVRAGLTWWGVIWSFVDAHVFNWHPVTWFSHMLDCQLFGLNAGAHHLVNVAFHATNSALLFILLRNLTGAVWRSAFVAALFAWHPLRVESVAWISERKDVLSGFFCMLSLLSYTWYAQRRNPGNLKFRRSNANGESKNAALENRAASSRIAYVLALIFFGLGLLSKPMLVTLPFVLLLIDLWPLGRLRRQKANWATEGGEALPLPSRQNWAEEFCCFPMQLVREKVPFFLLSAVVGLITFLSQRSGGAMVSLKAESITARVGTALTAYLGYLEKFFWPRDLTILYLRSGSISTVTLVCAICIFSAVTVLAILACFRSVRSLVMVREPLALSEVVFEFPRIQISSFHLPRIVFVASPFAVGWFWFLIMLVPVCGIVQVGPQLMADRYTYLPSIGLVIVLAWSLPALAQVVIQALSRRAPLRIGFWTMALVALMACMIDTRGQLAYWRNTETLMMHALEFNPNNAIAHQDLANYYAKAGQTEQARKHRQRVMELELDNSHPKEIPSRAESVLNVR